MLCLYFQEDKHVPILAFLLSYRGQQQGEEVQLFAANLLMNQVNKFKKKLFHIQYFIQ